MNKLWFGLVIVCIALSFIYPLVQESLAKIEFKLPDDSLMRMDRHLADYKCGEFSGAETLFIRPDAFEGWKTEARNLNENMVTSKNQEMASRILDVLLFSKDSRLFFAVDAGHLTGRGGDTVIDILREEGLKVTRVRKSDSMFSVLF